MLYEEGNIEIFALHLFDYRPGEEYNFLDLNVYYRLRNGSCDEEIYLIVALNNNDQEAGVGFHYGDKDEPVQELLGDVLLDVIAKAVPKILIHWDWRFIDKVDDGTHIWYNYRF